MAALTQQQLEARQEEIRSRLEQLDTAHEGIDMPEGEARTEWNSLNAEYDENEKALGDIKARRTRVAELAEHRTRREDEEATTFHTRRAGVATGDEIYDLSTVEMRMDNPRAALDELRDRAMRSVEKATFPNPDADEAHARGHIAKLLDTVDGPGIIGSDKVAGELARRILVTGNPHYKRGFAKMLAGQPLDNDEARALSIGTGSAGGFAVVYTLDPTVVPTSNSSVNPFRAVSRIETIAGTNEWKALTSGAITAAYAAEATEASDNAPTLAQPDIIAERCQAFVPFSIELGQDWGGLQGEMASLFQDAKDDVEATKFATGAGHGSTEPKGIITGATATTTAGGSAAFAIADLYKLFEALPPRFRPRAQWMANLFAIDKIRQFDTSGGSGVWLDAMGQGGARGLGGAADSGAYGTLGSGNGGPVGKLLGRNFWESTGMATALTTGQKILVVGDWRYFVIVDRVGMDIEVLPHLLGANRRPTGQRGLYAYWRNSSDVLSASAFQVLVTG